MVIVPQGGTLLAGALKILPMFLLVFPGMAARILFKNQASRLSLYFTLALLEFERCNCTWFNRSDALTRSSVWKFAAPRRAARTLPTCFSCWNWCLKVGFRNPFVCRWVNLVNNGDFVSGLRGLMLAVMLAALMSSLTSIFNSSSTLFTIDVWRLVRKNASEVELVIVGRWAVASWAVYLQAESVCPFPFHSFAGFSSSFSCCCRSPGSRSSRRSATPSCSSTFSRSRASSRLRSPPPSSWPFSGTEPQRRAHFGDWWEDSRAAFSDSDSSSLTMCLPADPGRPTRGQVMTNEQSNQNNGPTKSVWPVTMQQ